MRRLYINFLKKKKIKDYDNIKMVEYILDIELFELK